jgi:DNA-directed RNA polymerase subunit M/transcription elongation factor TFIIS
MEFCPKCGTLLVPKKMLVPKKIIRSRRLICPLCGYKNKIKNLSSYKIVEKGKEWREVVVITKNKSGRKFVNREYEIEPPEYEEEPSENGEE